MSIQTVICYPCLHVHSLANRVLVPYAGKHRIDPQHVRSACPKCGKSVFITDKRPATGPKEHCQNGRADVCLAGSVDGICCPDDSCDIDDEIRLAPYRRPTENHPR